MAGGAGSRGIYITIIRPESPVLTPVPSSWGTEGRRGSSFPKIPVVLGSLCAPKGPSGVVARLDAAGANAGKVW